jgi:hypothetical protein
LLIVDSTVEGLSHGVFTSGQEVIAYELSALVDRLLVALGVKELPSDGLMLRGSIAREPSAAEERWSVATIADGSSHGVVTLDHEFFRHTAHDFTAGERKLSPIKK